MFPPCLQVRLACREKPLLVPVGLNVNIGLEPFPTCKVVYCHPNPCVITPTTATTIVDRYDIITKELEKNILVELRFGQGSTYYVYPKKVWYRIERKYIEPLRMGNAPRESGVLLHGPPGTGKTSMMNILADGLGLYNVSITPDAILSKWVGESEKKISMKFKEAESNEPSIVMVDDAEWLVRSRNLLAADATTVSLTLLNIVLRKVEEWKKKNRRIIASVATNISPSNIDPALLRSGRLGKPIFIPLPDYEAVSTLLELLGVKENVEELASMIVNSGLSMADVVAIANDIMHGLTPEIENVRGRGYTRPIPPSMRVLGQDAEVRLREFERKILPCKSFETPHTRYWLNDTMSIGEAFMVTFLSYICNKPCVAITDDRYIDEALMTAEVSKAVIIADTVNLAPDSIRLINTAAPTPVVFVGQTLPMKIPVIPLGDAETLKNILGLDLLVRIVLSYYNISFNERDITEFLRGDTSRVLGFLREARYWAVGLSLREARRRVSPIW